VIIKPARRIAGSLSMPGDKSISHRAAMIAATAEGTSRIKNFSTSEDCAATLTCLKQLGARITREGSELLIEGVGRDGFKAPGESLDCGNSGTTMRLLAGILAGQTFESTLTGDGSLRSRPMQRIIEPLQRMGAQISSTDGRAPLKIRGALLKAIEYELLVPSAQVKSSILLAGLNASGCTRVIENPATRDHTERMLRWFGASIETSDGEKENERLAEIDGPASLRAHDVDVPGDISSAAYFVAAAALLNGSDLKVQNVGLNPTRTLFLKQMQSFGFNMDIENASEVSNEPRGTIRIQNSRAPQLTGDADSSLTLHSALIPQLIDELPLLALIGSQIKGGIEIRNAAELRVKESDRIAATVAGLRGMGAEVEEFEDGLRVNGPTRLRGASIETRADHRIAMTFAVAGLFAENDTEIRAADCVGVSFPGFFDLLGSVVER
jgi:3-phosphoshikimate 1-carboxyvinyltransferase